jgi:sirohydrochlorin cobaltochelatase
LQARRQPNYERPFWHVEHDHDHPHNILPPHYQGETAVSAAPMGAADLKFDAEGRVAWDTMWADFCDLALAGGPPHRGTLLEPVSTEAVRADPQGYAQVIAEIERGLRMITGLDVITDAAPGWIGLVCPDEAMALWMLRAIVVENVSVRREGQVLYLPAAPTFRLEYEIKNVVTVVAKTHHYWTEHRDAL